MRFIGPPCIVLRQEVIESSMKKRLTIRCYGLDRGISRPHGQLQILNFALPSILHRVRPCWNRLIRI